MKNKALVTGSCGFIGHHLVKGLKDKGYYVIGIDNLVNGDPRYGDLADEFYPEDIRSLDYDGDVEYIFHLAALPRVPYSIEHPIETHDANINGTLEMLELARKMPNLRCFVNSSSSSVYGEQEGLPLHEEMKPNPMSPYALQKLTGEYYCDQYRYHYDVATVSLRYFNVYGEDQDGSHPYATVVSKFLDLKEQGQPLTIHGDGNQTRDMTYVGDVVEANIRAAESYSLGTFNIGGGKEYSVNEVADMIGGETVSLPARMGEPRHTLADISKAKSELAWEPQTKLETWIKKQD